MIEVKESIQESVFRIIANSGMQKHNLGNLLVDFNRSMGASLKGASEDAIGIAFIAFSLGHLNIMNPGSAFNKNYNGHLTKQETI